MDQEETEQRENDDLNKNDSIISCINKQNINEINESVNEKSDFPKTQLFTINAVPKKTKENSFHQETHEEFLKEKEKFYLKQLEEIKKNQQIEIDAKIQEQQQLAQKILENQKKEYDAKIQDLQKQLADQREVNEKKDQELNSEEYKKFQRQEQEKKEEKQKENNKLIKIEEMKEQFIQQQAKCIALQNEYYNKMYQNNNFNPQNLIQQTLRGLNNQQSASSQIFELSSIYQLFFQPFSNNLFETIRMNQMQSNETFFNLQQNNLQISTSQSPLTNSNNDLSEQFQAVQNQIIPIQQQQQTYMSAEQNFQTANSNFNSNGQAYNFNQNPTNMIIGQQSPLNATQRDSIPNPIPTMNGQAQFLSGQMNSFPISMNNQQQQYQNPNQTIVNSQNQQNRFPTANRELQFSTNIQPINKNQNPLPAYNGQAYTQNTQQRGSINQISQECTPNILNPLPGMAQNVSSINNNEGFNWNQVPITPQQNNQYNHNSVSLQQLRSDDQFFKELIHQKYVLRSIPFFNQPVTISELAFKELGQNLSLRKDFEKMFEKTNLTHISNVRGDGNCFFRSFFIGYILQKLSLLKSEEELKQFLLTISNLPILYPTNFESIFGNVNIQLLVKYSIKMFNEILQFATAQLKFKQLILENLNDPVFDFASQILSKSLILEGANQMQIQKHSLMDFAVPAVIQQSIQPMNCENGGDELFCIISSFLNCDLEILSWNKSNNQQNTDAVRCFSPNIPMTISPLMLSGNKISKISLLFKTGHYYLSYSKELFYFFFQN